MAAGVPTIALYIAPAVGLLCLVVIGVICYLCCAKRFRLNWFQRTLLDSIRSARDNTEKEFLQPPSAKRSQTSLVPSATSSYTSSNYKSDVPTITIAQTHATIVTRKVRQQHDTDSSSMGSNSSSEAADKFTTSAHAHAKATIQSASGIVASSSSSSHHQSVYPQPPSYIAEKRVSFKRSVTSRRGSMSAAPVIPGMRKGSSSASSASSDYRRDSAEFWVPPAVMKRKRAQSLVPSLGLLQTKEEDPFDGGESDR